MGSLLEALAVVSAALFAGGALYIGAALATGRWAWALGGLAVGAAIPLTLVLIMPTNRRLLGTDPLSQEEAARLLDRWGGLHWGRSVLGMLGLLIMVLAALAR
jgi:hypothetical protein